MTKIPTNMSTTDWPEPGISGLEKTTGSGELEFISKSS